MKLNILLLTALCCSCSSELGPVVPETAMERQMIGLLQKFDLWDDNGDGELDASELASGLKDSPYQPDKVLAFYDTDGNGRISIMEAQAGYKRAAEAETHLQN